MKPFSTLKIVAAVAVLLVASYRVDRLLRGEQPGDVTQLSGNQLLEIRGLHKNDARVRAVIRAADRLGGRHAVSELSDKEVLYTWIDPPLEICFDTDRFSSWYEEKHYVSLVRIGSQQERIPSAVVDHLLPYGITTTMTPSKIHDKCDQPYAMGIGVVAEGGDGSITFYEDPISPFPITVWFRSGMVCGVDIHTWGPVKRDRTVKILPNKPHHPTASSRSVPMNLLNYNLNPVLDFRRRY